MVPLKLQQAAAAVADSGSVPRTPLNSTGSDQPAIRALLHAVKPVGVAHALFKPFRSRFTLNSRLHMKRGAIVRTYLLLGHQRKRRRRFCGADRPSDWLSGPGDARYRNSIARMASTTGPRIKGCGFISECKS
jgi:hypothetical protein